MNKVVLHPSLRKKPRGVLQEVSESNPARLMIVSRNEDGELEIACCDEWHNEDLALSIAMLQVWFNELVMGSDEGE